jgi:hypothetical protein
MSVLQAIGLTTFPLLGGFAGSLITRKNVDSWYKVRCQFKAGFFRHLQVVLF